MKNLNILLISLALSFMAIGCSSGDSGGKKARSHDGNPREFRGDVQSQSFSNTSNFGWGQIYEYNHGYNVANFQSRVENFLYPQLERDEIGTVSGEFGDTDTGVFFYGRGIRFNSTPRLNNDGYDRRTNIFRTNSAELRIEVEDRFSGSRSVIPIHFNEGGNGPGGLTASLVDREFFQLVFEDEFGKVSLEGTVFRASNGDLLYQGDIWYRNLSYLREGQSIRRISESERFLGGFTINACNFFDMDEILDYDCR